MKRTRCSLIAAVLLLTLGASARAQSDQGKKDPGEVTLFAQVENPNEYDALMFAYRNGHWVQLGVVRAGATMVLPFTWDQREVRFVIELQDNDRILDLQPETDARKTYAAEATGLVPCHLTGSVSVEANMTIALTVDPKIKRNRGASRCQPRR